MTRETQILEPIEDADIATVAMTVEDFARSRVSSPQQAQDIAQETVARLLAVRSRLDRTSAIPYAIGVARNLIIADARRADVERRHAHRVVDVTGSPGPEETTLRRDEISAMRSALSELSGDDRRALIDHTVEGRTTLTMAAEEGGTAGGVAARLARIRARARVDYVLASRNVSLPTGHCRPVLDALSAGDRRRQGTLGAAGHLLRCETCHRLAPPLVARERSLASLVPIPLVAAGAGHVRGLVGRHGRATAVGAAAVAVAVTGAALVLRDGEPQKPPAVRPAAAAPTTAPAAPPVADPPLSVGGVDAFEESASGQLARHVGAPVRATAVPVQSVPADEGFWVGDGPGRRVWVQLRTVGESGPQVEPGVRVTFTGDMVAHGDDFPGTVGVDDADGAPELTASGAHVEVNAGDVVIER